MCMGSLFVMIKCFKIRQLGWLYNLLSILKSTEFVKDEFYDTGIISQFFFKEYLFYLTLDNKEYFFSILVNWMGEEKRS